MLDGIEFDISNLLDRKKDDATGVSCNKSHDSVASSSNGGTSSTFVTAGMGDSMTNMSCFSSRRSSYQSSHWSSATSRSVSLENSIFYLGDSMRSVDEQQFQSTNDEVISETHGENDDAESSHYQHDRSSGGTSSGSSGPVSDSSTSRSVRSLPQHVMQSPPPSRVIRRSASSGLPTFRYPSPKDIPRDDKQIDVNDLFRRRFSHVLQYQQHQQRRTLTKHKSESGAVFRRPSVCAAREEQDDETGPDLDRHVSEVSKVSTFSNESGNSDGQNSHGQESVQSNANSSSSSIVTQITKNLGRKAAQLKSIARFGSGHGVKYEDDGSSYEDGSSYVENGRVYTVRDRPPPPRMYQREMTTAQNHDGDDDDNPHQNIQDSNLPGTMNLKDDDYTTTLRDDSSSEVWTSTSSNSSPDGYLSKHHPRRHVRRSISYNENERSVHFPSPSYEGGLAPLPAMKRRSRSDEGSAVPSFSATGGEWDDDLRGHNHQLRTLQRRRSSMTSPVRSSGGRSLFPSKGQRKSMSNRNEKVYQRKLVEVTPGTFVPLRGSDETWDSIKEGRTVTACCTGCSVRLYCIDTVSMVMCPDCDLIFPIVVNGGNTETSRSAIATVTNKGSGSSSSKERRGGLGLGMKEDDALLELNRIG